MSAMTPPIMPRIRPINRPPPLTKLTRENRRIITPHPFAEPAWDLSWNAPTITTKPAIRPILASMARSSVPPGTSAPIFAL